MFVKTSEGARNLVEHFHSGYFMVMLLYRRKVCILFTILKNLAVYLSIIHSSTSYCKGYSFPMYIDFVLSLDLF
jgi:hypothetical protein